MYVSTCGVLYPFRNSAPGEKKVLLITGLLSFDVRLDTDSMTSFFFNVLCPFGFAQVAVPHKRPQYS